MSTEKPSVINRLYRHHKQPKKGEQQKAFLSVKSSIYNPSVNTNDYFVFIISFDNFH